MDERIKQVMTAVFEIAIEDITEDASSDTIETWDSLKHMNMMAALEEEFSIEFSDEEILEMTGYRLIKEALLSKPWH